MTGKVTTLNRFVFRETNKCLPFFKVLKKALRRCPDEAKRLPNITTIVKSVSNRRIDVHLFGGIQHGCKLGTDRRKEGSTEVSILYQSNFLRS